MCRLWHTCVASIIGIGGHHTWLRIGGHESDDTMPISQARGLDAGVWACVLADAVAVLDPGAFRDQPETLESQGKHTRIMPLPSSHLGKPAFESSSPNVRRFLSSDGLSRRAGTRIPEHCEHPDHASRRSARDLIDQPRSPKSNQVLTWSASSTSGSQTPSIIPIR